MTFLLVASLIAVSRGKAPHPPSFTPTFVPPPPSSDTTVRLDLSAVLPPKLYRSRDNSTFMERIAGLVGRLNIRLNQYAGRQVRKKGKKRLSSSRTDFTKKISEDKLLSCFAKFSYEASEYDEQLLVIERKLSKKSTNPRLALEKAEKVSRSEERRTAGAKRQQKQHAAYLDN